MASDIKISELTVATTSTDADVLPIVQSNETKQVTRAILTSDLKASALGNVQFAVDDSDLVVTKTKVNGTISTDTIDMSEFAVTVDDELSTTSENPVQNKVITANIEDLEEENAELKNIIDQIVPTTTQEGIDITLQNTLDTKLKSIIPKGNTSQETYSGKNIFNLADLSGTTISNKTTTGFTFTKVGGGRFSNTIQLAKAIPSGTTIYLSGTITSDTSTSSLFVQFGTDSDFNSQASSHLNAYKNLTIEVNYMRLYYLNTEESGVSCNVDKMQIEIGNSATSYEQYTRKYSST